MKNNREAIKTILYTEKGTSLTPENKYLFKVDIQANKLDIKREIENRFGVSVLSVNTLIYKGKKKRERTLKYGKTACWKKAVITLKQGETIEIS